MMYGRHGYHVFFFKTICTVGTKYSFLSLMYNKKKQTRDTRASTPSKHRSEIPPYVKRHTYG